MVKLVVFDFDGVFTDGKFYFGADRPTKSYNGRDSFGLKKLIDHGIEIGIITNDESVSLNGAVHIRERVRFFSASSQQSKIEVLTSWKDELGLQWDQVAYMGDDLPDLSAGRWLSGISSRRN